MKQRFEKIEHAIDEFRENFTAIDARFEAVDARFDNLARDLDAREKRILNAFRIESERIRENFAKAAEGFAAMLESIHRKLDDRDREWHAKWSDHDTALKDHAVRITSLERRRKS